MHHTDPIFYDAISFSCFEKISKCDCFFNKRVNHSSSCQIPIFPGKRSEAVIVALKKAAQQILQKFRGKQLWANSVQLS